MMKIGVSGASGKLGGAVVNYLLEMSNENSIVAISRAPEKIKIEGVQARFGDYNQPSSLSEAYRGLDRLLLIPSLDVGHRLEQNARAIDPAFLTLFLCHLLGQEMPKKATWWLNTLLANNI